MNWQPIETAPKVIPDDCMLVLASAQGWLLFAEWCDDGQTPSGDPWSGWISNEHGEIAVEEIDDYDPPFVPVSWFLLPPAPRQDEEPQRSEGDEPSPQVETPA